MRRQPLKFESWKPGFSRVGTMDLDISALGWKKRLIDVNAISPDLVLRGINLARLVFHLVVLGERAARC